jgi:hypothetical protein
MNIFKIILYILCPCLKQKDNTQPLKSIYTSPHLTMKLFEEDNEDNEDNEDEKDEEYFYYF